MSGSGSNNNANSNNNTATDTRKRVKLYILNENRQWDDKGTGHVASINQNDKLHTILLHVKSELDGSTLLESRVLPHTSYQKQQDTLIVWSESDRRDLALSFQEKAGCDEVWEKICEIQGKDPTLSFTRDSYDESDEDQLDSINDTNTTSPLLSELPSCEMNKLKDIRDLFNDILRKTSSLKEKFTNMIENESYIRKLIDLFRLCEDIENLDGLHCLYEIFRNIFYLNRSSLFDQLLSDDYIMDVIGCLEYDPSKQDISKHREFINTRSKFKEVIPFNNTDLIQKIHQTYRIQYIQDVILPAPSVFEENSLASLTSFVFLNKVEISNMIQEDERFLKELFESLKNPDLDEQKRLDMFQFLREFISFSHGLQQTRESLYKSLQEQGILQVLEVALKAYDAKVNMLAVEIFSHFVEATSTMIREYILNSFSTPTIQKSSESPDNPLSEQYYEKNLLNLVIRTMDHDPDQELGGAMQIINLLKLLIDPENMLSAINKAEKSEFLTFFYKRCISVLLTPLVNNTNMNDFSMKDDDYRKAQLQNLILDFLSFCVEHHTYHIKNYIIHKDLLKRILILLKSRHQFLALSALRFLRKTISLKEETYYRHIIKQNLFEPVVNALKTNGSRYNILNSAIIELFDFIKADDIKSLIMYAVDSFQNDFEKITYVKTFKELKLRYDQQKDRLNESCNTLSKRLSNDSITPVLYRTKTSIDRFGSNSSVNINNSNNNSENSSAPLEYDKDDDAWIEEDDNDELENKIEPNTSNHTNNSFNDDSDSQLETFMEFKKNNAHSNINDNNEDTIFSPINKLTRKTISINIKASLLPQLTTTTTSNGVTSPKKDEKLMQKIDNVLNEDTQAKRESHDGIMSPKATPAVQALLLLETPNNSPISAKKFPLVDYGYDSDEENDVNGNDQMAINKKDILINTDDSISKTNTNSLTTTTVTTKTENEEEEGSRQNSLITDEIQDEFTTQPINKNELSPNNSVEPATKRARLSNS